MTIAARKFIQVMLIASWAAVFLLSASMLGRIILSDSDILAPLHIVSMLGAVAVLACNFFVIRYLLGRLDVGVFNLNEALDEIRRLTSVIDKSFDGIVLTDTHGIIRHVNPKWADITGWTFEETAGVMTPAILKSGYQDAAFYSNFWLTIQNGKTFRGELINKKKDGSYYRVDEIVLPLKNRFGKLVGYAAFHHVLEEDFTPPSPPPLAKEYVEGS